MIYIPPMINHREYKRNVQTNVQNTICGSIFMYYHLMYVGWWTKCCAKNNSQCGDVARGERMTLRLLYKAMEIISLWWTKMLNRGAWKVYWHPGYHLIRCIFEKAITCRVSENIGFFKFMSEPIPQIWCVLAQIDPCSLWQSLPWVSGNSVAFQWQSSVPGT